MNITKDGLIETHVHSRSIAFEGREPELYTGYTHKGKQWIPSHAYAEWRHGKAIEQINVSGPLLKKDGTRSVNTGRQRYCTPAHMNWGTKYGRNAPAWLLELFADSPLTTPEGATA